ncbi:hypothetical protein SAMN05192575_107224 [Nocardioides alpinus]|uniref:DoxX protein n=1 Tax=Nocardioides alpinus TaxID=748909 RepID=A0A1I1A6K8_9ACTN|nr:hypothetical protein [Nocardioides alpinus]PKH42097.1 hypothetical protein CXG46_06345 [Nocardioides alpinus]SFB32996.1 hypothetical protein SAMN05192575_107224 [Nocardioides alpinus]
MTLALPALVPVLPTHERWFVESQPAGDWAFFLSPLPLVLTAAVVVVTLVWRTVAMRVDGPELPFLGRLGALVPWIPRLLGIHLGVTLLALASTGAFITPSIDHLGGLGGHALLLVEAALGIWLITGWQLRAAAALVLMLAPALTVVAGWTALGESANLAAVAAFLVVVPPGPDAHGAAHPSRAHLRWALLWLRLGVGTALIVLAFSEKLTNPAMAIDTLERFPALDVLALVGISVSPETFVAIAGATELLFGLLVISGAFPQVAVLVAMVPFNATLLLFGQTEMVGHLPVYGVFLALLVYGSSAQTAGAVRWLPSPRGRRVAVEAAA